MSNESKAAIVAIAWVSAFGVGCFKGGNTGLLIIMLSTAMVVSAIYIDMLRDRAKSERRNQRRRTAIYEKYHVEMADIERSVEKDNDNRT